MNEILNLRIKLVIFRVHLITHGFGLNEPL
jgi:hypothetical protein